MNTMGISEILKDVMVAGFKERINLPMAGFQDT